VKQSGTQGAHVAVVGTTDTIGKAITLQFVQDLNRIGYVATAKLLSNAIQYPYIQDSRNHVQVGYSQWYQDYRGRWITHCRSARRIRQQPTRSGHKSTNE
jgi:peptide/nickel transport system substrate-binding protein